MINTAVIQKSFDPIKSNILKHLLIMNTCGGMRNKCVCAFNKRRLGYEVPSQSASIADEKLTANVRVLRVQVNKRRGEDKRHSGSALFLRHPSRQDSMKCKRTSCDSEQK